MAQAKKNCSFDTGFKTGLARFSYANVHEPMPPFNNPEGKKRFSIQLLIPKTDTATINGLAALINKMKADPLCLAVWGGQIPYNFKIPVRDGDRERPGDETYKGMYFINASSSEKNKPGLAKYVAGQVVTLEDPRDLYSGVFGIASINLFAFNTSGNAGISAGIRNLLVVKPGEPLGNVRAATTDFKGMTFEDDVSAGIDLPF